MKRTLNSFKPGLAGLALLLLSAAPSQASVMFGFESITTNGVASPGILEAQISFTVTEPIAGQVLLTFNNVGPDASSIADIYLDDPTGLIDSIVSLDNSDPGVDFGIGASPPNLPSGNNINFSADFAADSNPPAQPNGVNPGETLGIVFLLTAGNSAADVIDSLNLFSENGLRVGVHVQGFANGESESGVHTPEPASLALLALGGTLMLGRKRR